MGTLSSFLSARKGLKWFGTPVPAWAQGLCDIPAFSLLLGQTRSPVSLSARNIPWKRREFQDLKQQYPKSCSGSRACQKQRKGVRGNFPPPSTTIFQVQLLPVVLSYHKVWDWQSWNWGVRRVGGEKVAQNLWIHCRVGKCCKTELTAKNILVFLELAPGNVSTRTSLKCDFLHKYPNSKILLWEFFSHSAFTYLF